ncbi:FliH/SctL family protein [Ammoniphilus sp. 3BR4]|uniref:FliH/SctL family protein n=1 Tax=Ammoniphilus sp. 3BR4 TaxID=3158265 RepID=UPI00346624ED
MSNIIKAQQYVPMIPQRSRSSVIRASEYMTIAEEVLISHEQTLCSNESVAAEDSGKPDSKSEMLLEAKREAEEVLVQAKQEAETIIQQALEETQLIYQKAQEEIEDWWTERRQEDEALQREAVDDGYRQGFQQGHAQGYESAWEEQQAAIDKTRKILEEAQTAKERWIQESEPVIMEIALAVAKKVIMEELSLYPEKMLSMVQEALKKVQEVDKITICVGPENYMFLEGQYSQLKNMLSGQADLLILPDHSIEGGGCLIRSAFGSVDARVDTQLGEISEALMSLAQGRKAGGTN